VREASIRVRVIRRFRLFFSAVFVVTLVSCGGPKPDKTAPASPEKLESRAKQGDAQAQYDLGLSYLKGLGTEKSMEKAIFWVSRSAEQGYAPAQSQWGFMLYQAQRFPEAAQFYRKSADQGYGEGLYNLAVCYERGHGVRQDQELAANYYLKAAQKGVTQAMYNLAVFYLQGVGVKKDRQEAEKWLVQASEDYPPARALLQQLRGNETGQAEGRERSTGGDTERLEKSDEEKFSETERRAREGDPQAQCNLGAFYLQGRGVPRDETQGFQWMKKAADAGDGLAQLNLAALYERGRGVRRNAKLSVAMLEQAFANGQAEAGYLLGLRYLYGNGVDQIPEEARKLWEQSARRGDASSQQALEKSRTLKFGDDSIPKYRLPPIPNPGRSLRPESDIPGGLYLRAIVNSPDGYVNLRSGRGVDRKVIEKIFRDEEVFVKVSDGDWWPCVFMPLDLTGFIHKSGIRTERQGPACEVVAP